MNAIISLDQIIIDPIFPGKDFIGRTFGKVMANPALYF